MSLRNAILGCLLIAISSGPLHAGDDPPAVDQMEVRKWYSVAHQYHKQADQYGQQGNPEKQVAAIDKAIKYYRRVLDLDPIHVSARLRLAKAHWEAEDFDSAAAQYDSVLAIDPANEHAMEGRSTLLTRGGDYDAAIDAYREQLESDPNNIQARRTLAQIYEQQEDMESAIEQYSELARLVPDDAGYPFRVGLLYQLEDDFVSSIEPLATSFALNPSDYEAGDRLASAYLKTSDYASAANTFTALITANPADGRLYLKKGQCLHKMGNVREAVAAYEGGLSQQADDVDLLRSCSKAYIELGQLDRAEAQLKRGLVADPENPQLHTSYGDIYEAHGDAVMEKFKEKNCKRMADEANRFYRLAIGQYRQAADDPQVSGYALSKVDVLDAKMVSDELLFFANQDC